MLLPTLQLCYPLISLLRRILVSEFSPAYVVPILSINLTPAHASIEAMAALYLVALVKMKRILNYPASMVACCRPLQPPRITQMRDTNLSLAVPLLVYFLSIFHLFTSFGLFCFTFLTWTILHYYKDEGRCLSPSEPGHPTQLSDCVKLWYRNYGDHQENVN